MMHVTPARLSSSPWVVRPAVAQPSGSSADQVELSAPALEARRPEGLPPHLLAEARTIFAASTDPYGSTRATNRDVSHDTGLEIDHRSGGGGCFGPSEHYWTFKEPGGEPRQIAIRANVLDPASGCSVNSDGTMVVGRYRYYSRRDQGQTDADLQSLRDRGLYEGESAYASPGYLVDIPLKKGMLGALPAMARRRGWLPPKVLTALPPDAGAFDVGPDKSVAVAQNDRVLRWTKKSGLQPWLQLSQKVHDLEYLSDGSLAVMTAAEVGYDIHVFGPGRESSPHYVPFSQAFPEQYESRLRSRVWPLEFLRDASVEEVEKFLANSDWIKKSDADVHPWQPSSSFGPAVVLWKQPTPELWSYDRQQGKARPLGFLTFPASERFSAPERYSFQAEATRDGKFLVARSQGEPQDLAVWDLETGEANLVPGVREVQLDLDKSELNARLINDEQRTIALGEVAGLKHEDWYVKARLADLLDSSAEPKPERQIGEDHQKVIVGGVHVRKKD